MKKYILPTLISLALSSSWVLAEEAAEPETPATAATAESNQEAATEEKVSYEDITKKRQEHRKKMREHMQKIDETNDPEERERLLDAYDEMMQANRKEMRKLMSKLDWDDRDMPRGAPPMPPYGYSRPPMPYGYDAPFAGRGYGYNARREPPPAYGDRPFIGNELRPPYGYDMPFSKEDLPPRMKKGFSPNRREAMQAHHAAVEERLENIEKLMAEVVKLLSSKQATGEAE